MLRSMGRVMEKISATNTMLIGEWLSPQIMVRLAFVNCPPTLSLLSPRIRMPTDHLENDRDREGVSYVERGSSIETHSLTRRFSRH
jgi:hypothetical protein